MHNNFKLLNYNVEHWFVTFVWSSLAVLLASEDSFLLGDSRGSLSDCEDREENSEDADEDTDMVMIYKERKKQIVHELLQSFHYIQFLLSPVIHVLTLDRASSTAEYRFASVSLSEESDEMSA